MSFETDQRVTRVDLDTVVIDGDLPLSARGDLDWELVLPGSWALLWCRAGEYIHETALTRMNGRPFYTRPEWAGTFRAAGARTAGDVLEVVVRRALGYRSIGSETLDALSPAERETLLRLQVEVLP